MSWHFSQALVAAYSEDTCSDGAQSAPLNGSPTQLAYLSPDKMTAFFRLSRFGMTFKPLTQNLGQDVLTSYLEDFPAKTFHPLERAQESTGSGQECGSTWLESLAKYDQDTSTWRTAQCSLLEDSTVFSGTWPRWGSMRNGVSYRQQTLVRHTKETGSGSWLMPTPTTNPEAPNHGSNSKGPHNLKEVALTGWKPGMMWPTPAASDGQRGGTITDKMTGQSLPQMVNTPAKWPTPISQDAKHSGYAQSGPGKADKLSYAVVRDLWPTPTAHNAKETNAPSESQRNTPTLAAQAGGTLNPTWVEWLMGWPLGWTDLKPLEMDKYQQWQQQHGIY